MRFAKWVFSSSQVYLFAFFFSNILQSSDVLAVTHKKSPSKPSLSSSRGRGNQSMSSNYIPGKGIPSRLLSEIRSLDNQLLCFPKLLCTIYQDDSITKRLASFNVTELGVAYLKLLKAVHYMSSSASGTTISPTKFKRPIIQIFQIPSGIIKTSTTYTGRKDHLHSDDLEDYPHHLRSPLPGLGLDHDDDFGDGDDYNLDRERANPLGDEDDDDEEDREFLRERLEISQMMQDLKQEDKAEYAKDSSSHSSLASSFLSSFLPFMGSRSSRSMKGGYVTSKRTSRRNYGRKGVHIITKIQNEEKRSHRNLHDVPQDPFWKAVSIWQKLKSRNQCSELYKTCPFEAWEIVKMLDLVKGQKKVLSAYLKITVDKVKPSRIRN